MMWATARIALLTSGLLIPGGAVRKRSPNASVVLSVEHEKAPFDQLMEAPFDELVQAPFDNVTEALASADESAPTVESLLTVSRCPCPPTNMWSYQRLPKAQNGAGCIGGCRGSAFLVQRHGATVRRLECWANKGDRPGIKAMRITFHDYHAQTIGNPEGGRDYRSFDFEPGEYCVGNLVLSGNGIGTRLGYIKFRTSLGRTFEYKPKTNAYKYNFPTNDAFMAGFAGREGDEIDLLAVIFWKRIEKISFVSISYPDLHKSPLRDPVVVASRTYCNDNSVNRTFLEEITKKQVTVGRESCLTSATSSQFGLSVSVSGGIPGLKFVDATGGYEWNVGSSITTKNCKTETESKWEELYWPLITLQPRQRTRYQHTQWAGVLRNLPFSAQVRVTLFDDTVFTRRETGKYNGAHFKEMVSSFYGMETNVITCVPP